jgi:hypothetical protein
MKKVKKLGTNTVPKHLGGEEEMRKETHSNISTRLGRNMNSDW